MVVQGLSVSHLDPLNTQANFQHPFKLSSSYHFIKGSEVYTELRSPYTTSPTRYGQPLSLSHSYFPLRSLQLVHSKIHIHSRKSYSVDRISNSFHLNLKHSCNGKPFVLCFVQIYKPMNPMKRQIYSDFRDDSVG